MTRNPARTRNQAGTRNHARRWPLLVAGATLAVGLIGPSVSAFAAVATPIPKSVMDLFHSKKVAAYLHAAPATVAADLAKHESLDQVAAAGKVSQANLVKELDLLSNDRMAAAVKKHHMTSAQASAREKQLAAAMPRWAAATDLTVEAKSSSGPRKPIKLSSALTAEVASLLHLTPAEVTADLKSGKTLGQIAAGKGVSEATLIHDLVAYMTKTITARVTKMVTGS